MIHNDDSELSGLEIQRGFIDSNHAARLDSIVTRFLGEVKKQPFKFNFFHLDNRFCKLLDNDWLFKICESELENGFRFDNTYGIQQPGYAYSVPDDVELSETRRHLMVDHVHYGRRVPEIVFLLFLTDQKDYGFFHVPGSHLNSRKELDQRVVVEFKAGDAILFPRKLLHGYTDMPMGSFMRCICMTFVPGYMCSRPYHEISHFGSLADTDRTRKLFRPPYVESIRDDRQYIMNPKLRD